MSFASAKLAIVSIELLDIECVLDHVTGKFEQNFCPNKSVILDSPLLVRHIGFFERVEKLGLDIVLNFP